MQDYLVNAMIGLSEERDKDRLLEKILRDAMEITNCDGGTVYIREGDFLYFRNMITVSAGIHKSARDDGVEMPPVPLGRKHVCACAALDGKRINLPDIYHSQEYDFAGARQYDELNHYRTKSMLVVPMVDPKERVIGVLQLINAQDGAGEIVPFGEADEELIFGLSSLVAVCLNNQRLSQALYDLLHSFIRAMVSAIDLRTPYNANHTKSMVRYGERFIGWLNGRGGEWTFSEEEIDPFLMSIWLHDIGKLITPLSVMEKATRLGRREPFLTHRLTVAVLMERLRMAECPDERGDAEQKLARLEDAKELIEKVNKPVFLTDELLEQVNALAGLTCLDAEGNEISLLTDDELDALMIRRGTLTEQEREIMEGHVAYTAQMLAEIQFADEYASVPLWASMHHELLDGSGYPDRKTAPEIPREVRLLTILDVYDALTAGDRPYKAPLPPERAFGILEAMAQEGKVDGEVLGLFKESGVWEPVDRTSKRQ